MHFKFYLSLKIPHEPQNERHGLEKRHMGVRAYNFVNGSHKVHRDDGMGRKQWEFSHSSKNNKALQWNRVRHGAKSFIVASRPQDQGQEITKKIWHPGLSITIWFFSKIGNGRASTFTQMIIFICNQSLVIILTVLKMWKLAFPILTLQSDY